MTAHHKQCMVLGCKDRKQYSITFRTFAGETLPEGYGYILEWCGTHWRQWTSGLYDDPIRVERIRTPSTSG